ncbi:thermonuclease family protein [Sphingomonas sp. NSE70-1]|uniref:Thermonuclease family protein n=1 Tax=Sphingomonas caseinilyticus TaxID=2908205 RepID=A0ABT0RVW3_9SPHN|nr:thermonuclease family protein [Sphingomonas caseinilyticus]MCL6699144.1 thermonuclease family protein [Sphingomonas caseinilyticus]
MNLLSTWASEGLMGEGWPRRWTHDPKCAEEKSLGDRATQRLIGLVNSGEVTLAPIDRDEDSYGRKLRIVKVDGESVGETLVEDGLARWYEGGRKPWC